MTTPYPRRPIYVGFSPEDMVPTVVAERSLFLYAPVSRYTLRRVSRGTLRDAYTRPTTVVNGHRYDLISEAPMSTDHAIARFFVPWLCAFQDWALFTDGDVLCRRAVDDLFACADDHYAVLCVQHPPLDDLGLKKLGDVQIPYARKNWSSVVLFNCAHPANQALQPDYLNTVPGRDLHRFAWLTDDQIGALPPDWNYLVDVSPPMADPALVHFTRWTPNLPEYAHCPFSDEWYRCATRLCGYKLTRPALEPPPLEAVG